MVSTWVSLKNNRAYVYLVALGATDNAPRCSVYLPARGSPFVRRAYRYVSADIARDILQEGQRVAESRLLFSRELVSFIRYSRAIRLAVTRGEGRVTLRGDVSILDNSVRLGLPVGHLLEVDGLKYESTEIKIDNFRLVSNQS